jgi:hypothetical protein
MKMKRTWQTEPLVTSPAESHRAGWLKYVLPLLLFICTTAALMGGIQFAQPELHLSAEDSQASPYLYLDNFFDPETSTYGTYRWSGTNPSLTLEDFAGQPVLLTLRLSSPRPPGADVAKTRLESGGWKSGDFVVSESWRTYHILVPVSEERISKVWIDVLRFEPGNGDHRSMGIAVSNLDIALASTATWHSQAVLQPPFLLALVLPMLMYLVARPLIEQAYTWSRIAQLAPPAALALVLAAATLVLLVLVVVLDPLSLTLAVSGLSVIWVVLLVALKLPYFIHPERTAKLRTLGTRMARMPSFLSGTAIQARAWTRTDYALAAGLAGTTLLLRLLKLPHAVRHMNADDYLVGVFAFNILKGNFRIYYGETGTLSSYLIAPLLAITGASTLALFILPITCTIVLVIALYGLGNDLGGRWGGVVAASCMVLPSAMTMFWSLKLQPGYIDAITCATLALWGTVHLLYRDTMSKTTQTWLMTGIAVAATLALWTNLVVISILFTCTVAALIAWRRVLALPRMGYLLALATGLGLLIVLVLPAHLHTDHKSVEIALSSRKLPVLGEKIVPALLGLSRPAGIDDVGQPLRLALATLVTVALLVTIYQTLFRHSQAALLVLIFALAAFGVPILSNFYTTVRYFFPFSMVALPLLLAILVGTIQQSRYRKAGAPLLLATIVLLHGGSSFGGAPLRLEYAPRPEAVLAQSLQAQGIRYIHTSYWVGMGVMFESGGAITASSAVGPSRESYDRSNESRVLAAGGTDTAFVFRHDSGSAKAFEEYTISHNMHCQHTTAHAYSIYYACTPFPDIEKLGAYLP